MEKFYAVFNYIDAILLPKNVVEMCSHSGDCEGDVVHCLQLPEVKEELAKINPEQLQKELKEYGAWDADQLANHEDNLMRILWLAAGNIKDEGYSEPYTENESDAPELTF